VTEEPPTPGPTRGRARPEVYRITGAPRSLTADVRFRQSRYLVSMAVRTACFVLAIVASGWLRWAFFAGAVVLPYVAVVFANAGRERAVAGPPPVPPPARPMLDGPRRD
jgi:hypothetical protein